jgi:hypothetical protein
VLFLVTFVTAIAAVALFQPVLDHPIRYVAGAGSDNRISGRASSSASGTGSCSAT